VSPNSSSASALAPSVVDDVGLDAAVSLDAGAAAPFASAPVAGAAGAGPIAGPGVEAKLAVAVAKQDEFFAQDAHRQRRAVVWQLFSKRHRLPVAAQQISARCARAGTGD